MAKRKSNASGSAPIGYEAQLWQMADALRNNMDAAQCEHLGIGSRFHNDTRKDPRADQALTNGSMSSNQSGQGEAIRRHRLGAGAS